MSLSLAGTQDSRTVVLKNLAAESTVLDIENLLKSIHMVSSGIDRKVDSMGQFRGIAFVRFATPEIAQLCVDTLDKTDSRLNQKRVKAEILRGSGASRSYSAREILEAGDGADSRLTRVRDLISAFVHSDQQETILPTDFDSEQRKLAHSLAEKFGLVHATVSPNGEALDVSPRHVDATTSSLRAVRLSKKRSQRTSNSSFSYSGIREQQAHSMASLVTAAVTNDLNKISPLLPEVPVFAATPACNLDQLAMMHATQAQVHADAAKAALEAAKRSKETDAMPDWLEVIEAPRNRVVAQRGRSRSNLNPNAPVFVPSASLGEELRAPPGLSNI